MNLYRLNNLYTNSSLTMEEVAKSFGYSRRQLTGIIAAEREKQPDLWPKRNGTPPLKRDTSLRRRRKADNGNLK